MLLGKLLEKTDILEMSADTAVEIGGICYDSRKLKPGELFIAVRGFSHDGHDYIEQAVDAGAACVLCQMAPSVRTPYVLVGDSRKALAAVSAAWFSYPASGLKVIGVTGTNGKTTVTSLLKRVIEGCTGGKAGLIGTNGNKIGDEEFHTEYTTPESLEIQEFLSMAAHKGCRYVVMEVSSHALRLDRVHGIEFETGVFTNLSRDHLDFHESMDDYAGAKSLLFKQSRNAAISVDDEYAPLMIESSAGPVVTYSTGDDAADFVAKSIKLHGDRAEFCAVTIGNLYRVEIPIPGLFSVYNALAVLSATRLLGFDTEDVVKALKTCGGVKGRAEVVPVEGDFTVLVDYAHTPDALRNIITAAKGFTGNRVVTLFGCGGDRDKVKRPLMGCIAVDLSDLVVVTSDNPRTEKPDMIINDILTGLKDTKTPYKVIENRREAIFWALDNLMPGDVLILAGKGHETYQIIGREKRHFDDREVVADYYAGSKGKHV